jgi:hypothetical protein
MSVINFPYNKPMPKEVTCVLCKRSIPISEATIGPINAKGEMSLLCNGHLWDDLKLIDELADYIAEERRKFFQANGHNLTQFGVIPHVRTLY